MIEILLVDDETYLTESLARTIPWQEMGIDKVYQASSGSEALKLLEDQSIDILVTDIRMPEMDGLMLIDQVSQKWPHIRSILLTGHSDFEYAKKAIQLQAFDYLLKPVNDDIFVNTLMNVIEALKDDWVQTEQYQKLLYNRKSDFTVLRANLMQDLLLGRQLSNKIIKEKLIQYEINLEIDDSVVMMFIQLGKQFTGLDHHSVSLMEYAIGNIAEEVFMNDYQVWHCKAPHDHLILMVSFKQDIRQDLEMSKSFDRQCRSMLEESVKVLQRNVSNYLKGDISILITDWFQFPNDIPTAYRAGMGALFLIEQGDSKSITFLEDQSFENQTSMTVESLYKPPTLIHLLESRQWEAAQQKIDDVFAELQKNTFSKEHIYEVFLSITNAFMYITHKQGQFMHQIDHSGVDLLFNPGLIHSIEILKDWSRELLEKLKVELSSNELNAKKYIIKQVQEIVSNDLGQDTSVKSIADRVYLHPVYLSKIYKMEMGESLGDYIIRMKMERALYLLKKTNKKIYEITADLGYQNPQYFSKVFRKHYGLTPNEYRDQ